jgi:hypothetical protein
MAAPRAGKPGSYRTIGDIAGSAREAKERAKADALRREKAALPDKDGKPPRILTPEEVRSGNWDAQKLIETTLGGGEWSKRRLLTPEDLQAIRRNVEALGKRYQGGIRPRQVIDLSLESRRERAREEIRMAVPSYSNADRSGLIVVRFVTNAGPDTRSVPPRHHVTVQLMSTGAAVTMAKDTAKASRWLCREPLRFDCDCGDHTFRFRYIASAGKFNYGRTETGYPKIRNPGLEGIACKHVIRVMQQLDSGMADDFVGRLLDKIRKAEDIKQKSVCASQNEAEAQAKKQENAPAKIKTSQQRAEQTAKAREAAKAKRGKAAAEKAMRETEARRKPKPDKPPGPKSAKTPQALEAELRAKLADLGLEPTPEQIQTYIAQKTGKP